MDEANERNNTFSKSFEVRRPQKVSDFALERAARSYASYASAADVIDLIKTSQKLDADGKYAMMKGVLSGWNPKRKETPTNAAQQLLASLNKGIPADLSGRMTAFMESFGIKDMEMEDPNVQVITHQSHSRNDEV